MGDAPLVPSLAGLVVFSPRLPVTDVPGY